MTHDYECDVVFGQFAKTLPTLYSGWGTPSVQPKSARFANVLSRVRGMTTANVLQLLNLAVGMAPKSNVYLEIGSFHGATLIGAILDHPGRPAVAVDDFTLFDPQGQNHQALMHNLKSFHMETRVEFYNKSFESFFHARRSDLPPVGVYFYDGAHDYRSQLLGLLWAVPCLADEALIVVDDGNWPSARQAIWDFLALHCCCRLVFDLPTPHNEHPSFWNGVCVLLWNRHADNAYSWDGIKRHHQTALLESLNLLQEFSLHRSQNQVIVGRNTNT